MDKFDELTTIRQTVKRAKSEGFNISESALRRWVKTGAIRCVQSGNRSLVFWPTLKAFLCGSPAEHTA